MITHNCMFKYPNSLFLIQKVIDSNRWKQNHAAKWILHFSFLPIYCHSVCVWLWIMCVFRFIPPPLIEAAVCPCQRGHRGHGGGHPEDMPERQWPQTWGEQQPASALSACLSVLRVLIDGLSCCATVGGFPLFICCFSINSTSLCHLFSSLCSTSTEILSHSCLSLIFLNPLLLIFYYFSRSPPQAP